MSQIFTNKQASEIDNQIISDIQSLRNLDNVSTKQISCKTNALAAAGDKEQPANVLAEMVTEMVTMYLNESNINEQIHLPQMFNSTKVFTEANFVKNELVTPNVTGIFEPGEDENIKDFSENNEKEWDSNEAVVDIKPMIISSNNQQEVILYNEEQNDLSVIVPIKNEIDLLQRIPEATPQKIPDTLPQQIPEATPQKTPDSLQQRIPDTIPFDNHEFDRKEQTNNNNRITQSGSKKPKKVKNHTLL